MQPIFSYTYSLPYIALLLFYLVLFLSQKKQASRELNIRIACITAFLFFFGLRGYIFSDWAVYYPLFEQTPSIWSGDIVDFFVTDNFGLVRIEPGYKVYCVLLKSFFSDFFCFQFVSAAIDVFFLDYFFRRYSKNYALSFVLFILFGGLGLEINLMRNIKAIFLFLYSIKYIEKKNFKAYLLCNVIGMSFHFSSILFLPMYFLLNRNLSKTFIWITFIIGNILYLLQIKYIGAIVSYIASMVGGKYAIAVSSYLGSEIYGASYGISIGYIERTFTYLLLFWNYKKILRNNIMYGKIFLNSFLIYFVMFSFFSEASIFTDRFPVLFIFSYWILYPEFFSILKRKSNKLIFIFLLLCYGVLKQLKGSNIMDEYENVLFGTHSYQEELNIMSDSMQQIMDTWGLGQ
ncbi:hypothetical protein SAMD00024442_25_11 [Candidatus Symbiothrix dinenymphae]|nr:hypothetical protein SAMD00024442_25_11 [Candidatus Symbiothrix dinenymphae]